MVFQKISKMEVVSGNLVEKVSKLDDRRVIFQKISKTKGVFGNLVENRGQMIEKRVFFQKISNIEVCFGNLVEKVVGRSGLGEAIRKSLTYFEF